VGVLCSLGLVPGLCHASRYMARRINSLATVSRMDRLWLACGRLTAPD